MKSSSAPTTLAFALLGLVQQEPRSGYDLCQLFEATPMAHFSSSPGAIYPALKRLEDRGLVAGTTQKAGSLRPRKVYRPTPEGLEALRGWATQEVTAEDMVHGADEVMLRFSFLGQVGDDDDTRRLLTQLAAASDAYADELQHHLDAMRDLAPPHGRLALASGLEYHRHLADWARRTLAESFASAGGGGRKPGDEP
jgi:DNA-binding PadR family transcriptional regulator